MNTEIKRIMTVATLSGLLLNNASRALADDTNQAKPEPKPRKQVFIFNGGSPLDFVLALDRHFRTRLGEILSVPSALAHAQVPKMRLATDDPGEAFTLYNRLDNPLLGRWYWDGATDPGTNMHVLTLVPDKSVVGSLPRPAAKVKAIGLAGVPKSKWNALQEDVKAAQQYGVRQAEKQNGDVPEGEIHIQPASKVLIVSGSDGFIEMVESVVAAHRTNAELEAQKLQGPGEKPADK